MDINLWTAWTCTVWNKCYLPTIRRHLRRGFQAFPGKNLIQLGIFQMIVVDVSITLLHQRQQNWFAIQIPACAKWLKSRRKWKNFGTKTFCRLNCQLCTGTCECCIKDVITVERPTWQIIGTKIVWKSLYHRSIKTAEKYVFSPIRFLCRVRNSAGGYSFKS